MLRRECYKNIMEHEIVAMIIEQYSVGLFVKVWLDCLGIQFHPVSC